MTSFEVPPGSVVITPTALYQEMRAIHDAVTDMRGDLKEMAKAIPDHEQRLRKLEETQAADDGEVERDVADHESRLRAVERKLWLVAGFSAGIGGAVGGGIFKLIGG